MVVHHDLVSVHHAYQMVMIAQYGDGSKAKLSSDAKIADMQHQIWHVPMKASGVMRLAETEITQTGSVQTVS